MRPKDLGQVYTGLRPGSGPGDPAAANRAPAPAASSASEPSAEPAPVRAPGTGQGAGSRVASGSQSVSEVPTGARLASEAGSKAGAQRVSAFSASQGNAQSEPDNSDAPWTRFVFQGPFGPRATGLGTGKAAGIWKTPAAYIGRRPGVSGPERAAFIRELEEALCPNLPPPVKKITPEDIKVMLYLLEERERDLNTAARIGQSLVKQNSVLMEENSKLEAMLGSAREEILHLRYQVNLRDDLLRLYSDSEDGDDDEEEEDEEEGEEEGEEKGEEEEEEEEEGEEEEEQEQQQYDHRYDTPKPTPREDLLHHCPQMEALQQKLKLLEEENDQLREEASQLDTLEDEEQMLILECVEQFSEASQQMAELSEVLVFRLEHYERQQKEITRLQAQVAKLQKRCQSYGAETEKLQQQLASEKEIQMQFQEEEARPSLQETLAQELRMSLRRIISDPVYFMERYDLRYSEKREREQGFEAEDGLMPAEDIVSGEDFLPVEELGATEEVASADGVTEEAELVSDETEAWEEVEPELDEATRMNVVTSALEASGLGPSHLDMKYVLQQLANWQDAHYRRQLRQKMLQKGEGSPGGFPLASRTSCRSSSR
ncbi:Huntingtin-associated protein 1 [Tupaia chinensis]|uniref:Huntingtin-associated protein 1 n=1 Tax=Tupaia chinensis TaxID=246437 RepID=L9JX61_TUPCH|nr:Huntingtin-associated protein 1 [Tupaia chinensis]